MYDEQSYNDISNESNFQPMTMNSYKAFYRGKTMEVKAETSYIAQQLAAKHFKAKKSYEVTVMLLEVNGREIVHTPDF